MLESLHDLEEAHEFAASVDGARAQDALRLPDRILIELLEWVVGLYSGGKLPPTSSTSSSPASPRAGTPGKWLALKGVDVHQWRLRTLLNAAEAQIYTGAEDEAAVERARAERYAPLPGERAPGRGSVVTGGARHEHGPGAGSHVVGRRAGRTAHGQAQQVIWGHGQAARLPSADWFSAGRHHDIVGLPDGR
ncbi:hypothetical protein OG416_35380 (plasmid) [Streptomyces longwoodensis]|uniref:hypothetical protein n=1 Tax=Streptomyces longwoodensis TaxID=68231 RepID=UPI0030E1F854|nr:hypothetical protein OG416_35380 [Streptomyces longwoodensis]